MIIRTVRKSEDKNVGTLYLISMYLHSSFALCEGTNVLLQGRDVILPSRAGKNAVSGENITKFAKSVHMTIQPRQNHVKYKI